MDTKLTNRDIKENYSNVIRGDYGITPPYRKIGYNAGVYGWNWSAYEVNPNTVYIQGYRSFPKATHETKLGWERKASDKVNELRRKYWDEYKEKSEKDPDNKDKYYKQYNNKTNNLAEKVWNKYVIDAALHPKESKPKAVKLKQPKMTNKTLTKMSRGV